MFRKIPHDMRFAERERDVLDFWREGRVFERSVALREGAPSFTFYDGPPTANGRPHIGHILTRVIKDVIPRYRTMKGFHVLRKAGWDTHGLPVELEVEKALGIDGKPQIEAYGVEPFIRQCKESVWKYKAEWERMSERVGFWADMENPYITYENDYIESVWWSLRRIWDQGLLYQGHKVVPYCPRCGTPLSSHEVAQGYRDIEETSIFVRFRVLSDPGGSDTRPVGNTWLAAWTTTPWTLPSNVALCVHPEHPYALVDVPADPAVGRDAFRCWLAATLAPSLFGEGVRVLEVRPGSGLVGMTYEPVFPYAAEPVRQSGQDAFRVVSDPFVTLTDGTGIVHIAPAFGEDDARVGRRYDLPFVQLVREDGTFSDDVTDFAGQFCKEADPGLIAKLADDGRLLRTTPYAHSYPFCWRCDTPLIYYARDSWFIRMTAVRDRLLAHNASIRWFPENVRDGRFGNFLENVIDWGISRERYWGTPLPIWTCECGHSHLVGSIEELRSLSDDCPADIELHKPFVDAVHLACPACGGRMTRVPDVIDCWYDSGAMPFAQWHYPFENQALFERSFPADFISEAIDQTRGWFYTLLAISTLLFDRSSFRNCIVMGLVLDKDGVKMSKHKGNVVDPWTVLDHLGADAVRWYFCTASAPWLPSRFYEEAVAEGQRRYMGTFWNTLAFFCLYASLDGFDPADHELDPSRLSAIDRWLLSRTASTIRDVDGRLEGYDITGAARRLGDFVDELSNWYVRRNRERYWQAGMPDDKVDAYMTLYAALDAVTRLTAIFTPFMAESAYRELVRSVRPDAPESVHFCDLPAFRPEWVDEALESDMDDLIRLAGMGRAARNLAGLKVRQPLSGMIVVAPKPLSPESRRLLTDELNVKDIEQADSADGLLDYRFKPQLRTLGPRLGKRLGAVTAALRGLDGRAAMRSLRSEGALVLHLDGDTISLGEADLLVETVQPEGLAVESDRDFTVALRTTLTPALVEEGFVREMVSKIQTMRKESGFQVEDRIRLRIATGPRLSDIAERHRRELSEEVLASYLEIVTVSGPAPEEAEGKTWDINGEACRLVMAVDRED